jgi:hypothetical protein
VDAGNSQRPRPAKTSGLPRWQQLYLEHEKRELQKERAREEKKMEVLQEEEKYTFKPNIGNRE